MSTTWSIEHIPANGGASTLAALATWGFASLQMQFTNWGMDQAAVATRGGSIAFEVAQFAYLDKLVVWRNGTRFAHFWITGLGTSAQTQESRTYTLSGPSWWLAQYAPSDLSNVTVYTAGAYIALGMAAAIAAGAPIACAATLEASLDIGCPDVRSAGTVLALVQEAARHVPFSSGWWDPSGDTPVLTGARRSVSDFVTLTIGTDPIETFGLTPMPELQLKSVRIRFGWTGGASYYWNVAGTDTGLSGPNRLQCTLNYSTQEQALAASGCAVAEKVFADMSTLPWGGSINMHAADSDITPIRPGKKVNLAGGLAEWSTMLAIVQSVAWSITPEANDLCTLNLGAPDQLGVQDYFGLRAAVGSAAGSELGIEPSDGVDPTPGTYDDLNGGAGGGSPSGSIAVQARGGAWSLLGFAAYVGEPLRRWRLRTFGGSRTGYNGYGGCGGMSLSGAAQQSGTQYVEDDGSVTRTSLVTPTAGDGLGYLAPTAITDAYGLCTSYEGTGWCRTTTITATLVSTVGVGGGWYGCCTPDGTLYYGYAGTTTAALSAEDLPPAAIERMLATAEWVGATTAIRTIPTTGITGVYRETRYRTEHTAGDPAVTSPTLTGLSPWQRYQVTVALESRPVDSAGAPTGDGSWTADGTRQHYFIADLTGEGGIDWQVVEPTAGYETRIASTLVEVA